MVFLTIETSLDTIAKVCDYIIHPAKIAWALWMATVDLSYVLCLVMCLGALLLNIFGFKKYSKYAPLSVAAYTIIQGINSVLR